MHETPSEWEGDSLPPDPDRPSLQEIARQTYAPPYCPLKDSDISEALTKAGTDPNNKTERERFVRLVAASTHTADIDAVGSDNYGKALAKLGPDADEEDVLNEARAEAYHEAMEREQERQ
jgi:hypothetical protein